MFHIRFTPYDISGYTFDFLEKYPTYAVYFENKKKSGEATEPHYHIGIWSDLKEKSIRDDIKVHLRIPSSGRGKNNKYYMLNCDWKDPSYITKYSNVIKRKGDEDWLTLEAQGKARYLDNANAERPAGPQPPPAAKRVNVDKEIMKSLSEHFLLSKINGVLLSREDLAAHACTLVRGYGKGINIFKIREYVHGALWDDEDEGRSWLLNKISGIL